MAGRSEHAQTRFNGELSPRLHGRWDTELYRGGLARCENWQVLPQGPIRRRGGTSKRAALDGAVTREIPFRFSGGQDYVLVLGDKSCRLYSGAGADLGQPGGGTVPVQGPELVPAPAAPPWQIIATATTDPTYPKVDSYWNRWFLKRGAKVRVSFAAAETGAHTLVLSVGSSGYAFSAPCRFWGGALDVGVTLNYATPSYTAEVQLVAGTVYQLELYLEQGTQVAQSASGSLRANATAAPMASPWSALEVGKVQYVEEPAANRVILVHPKHPPQVLTRKADNDWTLLPVVFDTAPTEWKAGNYPAAVDIHQSRLWLGGTPDQPNAFWASRVGLLFDFRRYTETDGGASTPHAGPPSDTRKITPECALTQKVATKGSIRWLQGRQAMLVGTDIGAYSITAQRGAIAPDDMHIVQQSGFGAAAIQAIDIGDAVLYVSADRRKVRALSYSNDANAWIAKDLTFTAEHLTRGLVKEVHFAREPDPTILVLLQTGQLVACTYDPAEQVQAWWRFTTAGVVRSGAVCDGPDGSLVFLAAERGAGTFLEVSAMNELAEGRVYCDSALTVALPAGQTEVSGLDHLEGLGPVNVIVDGAELEEDQEVEDGTVTLTEARERDVLVTVGLPYVATAKTLKPVTSRGAQRSVARWVKLFLRLFDSALPEVDGHAIEVDRSPQTELDVPEPLFTGDAGPGDTEYEGGAQAEIVSRLPLRTEVLALHGAVTEAEV
jgi:hypothetical protein